MTGTERALNELAERFVSTFRIPGPVFADPRRHEMLTRYALLRMIGVVK